MSFHGVSQPSCYDILQQGFLAQQQQQQQQQQRGGYRSSAAPRGGIPSAGHRSQPQPSLFSGFPCPLEDAGGHGMPHGHGAPLADVTRIALAPAAAPAPPQAALHLPPHLHVQEPPPQQQQQQQGFRFVTAGAHWPGQQPLTGTSALFGQQQAAAADPQLLAAVQPAAAEAAQQDSRRVRRRRATARRSLLDVFDAALTLSDASQASEESDSDCDMLGSQGSTGSCSTRAAAGASPDAASPRCLFPPAGTGGAGSSGAPSPVSMDEEPGSPAAACQPGGTAGPGDHLLPLQHLLMSEQAQHLTALEVKAVVAKVAADLATLHDAGVLHRHVTIASVGLARGGSLATARLMGHPYNVDAGHGRRHTGGKKAGVDAYLAPELARCPADCVTYTPAGDIWSLGVVLFVLLSGSHVPFGNRGLCWTSIPNMPGRSEPVDKLQRWLEEHLVHKLSMINQLRRDQEKGKRALGGAAEMPILGLDAAACDLLLRLLAADPAARPSAAQVLRHPWLAEVAGVVAAPAQRGGPPGGLEELRRTASELARLGFAAGDREPLQEALQRHPSNMSAASTDSHLDFPPCRPSGASSAAAPLGSAGLSRAASTVLGSSVGSSASASGPTPAALCERAAQPHGAAAAPPPAGPSFVLGDGTSLQLLPLGALGVLAAEGLIPPDAGCAAAALPYPALGYAVQPVEVTVEGRRLALTALHAVLSVAGQPMLCAQPITVTHHDLQPAAILAAAAMAPHPAPFGTLQPPAAGRAQHAAPTMPRSL